MYPPDSSNRHPRASSPLRCWSMGRVPMAHPPGQRHPGFAATSEQRSEHEHGGAHLPHDVVGGFAERDSAGVDPDRVTGEAGAADSAQQRQGGRCIGELRYVDQTVLSGRQQGGDQDGERRVLGSRAVDGSLQGGTALDDELFHDSSLTLGPQDSGSRERRVFFQSMPGCSRAHDTRETMPRSASTCRRGRAAR